MNNTKKWFLLFTLVLLFVGLGTLSASELSKTDNVTKTTEITKTSHADKEVSSTDKISTGNKVESTSTPNKVENKTINKKNNTKQNIKSKPTISVLNTTVGNVTIAGTIEFDNEKSIHPNGTITLRTGDSIIATAQVQNGKYNIKTNLNNTGTYDITAEFKENGVDVITKSDTITVNVSALTPLINVTGEGVHVGDTNISISLRDSNGNPIVNAPLLIKIRNNTLNVTTDEYGNINKLLLNLTEGLQEVIVQSLGNDIFNIVNKSVIFNVTRQDPIIKLDPVKGVIGENITLTAYLTDKDGNNVTGGNLAFKLNGKTLRSDGRFDSLAPAMKFHVENGKVSYTIKADLYLRNAKNLTASYSGMNIFREVKSDAVEAQIQKRTAQVSVVATPAKVKHYDTLEIKVTAKDVTKNAKNTTLLGDNTKIILKINGVTLKDQYNRIVYIVLGRFLNNKTLYVQMGKDNTTTYNYTIPADMGAVTSAGKIRDYQVEAIFVGDNYYPGAKNTTKFQVERSNTTVNIKSVIVNKSNKLGVFATLKDDKNNTLKGVNKISIKINGKTYINSTTGKAAYWYVKDGNINLFDIQVDPNTTVKRVMIVTGERQAYTQARVETTKIDRTLLDGAISFISASI